MPKIDINIILKLPLSKRLLLLGGLYLIITGFFYYFLYSPKLDEKSALTVKLSGLKNTSAEKQKMADNLPRLKKERQDLDDEFQKALLQLPNEKEIANLLDSIYVAARTSSLEILTFKPGKEAPKGFYAEVTIDMKVEGGYKNLLTFFEKVAELPRIVNASGLDVTSGSKEVRGDVLLTASFAAITFKFLPQPAEAKK